MKVEPTFKRDEQLGPYCSGPMRIRPTREQAFVAIKRVSRALDADARAA